MVAYGNCRNKQDGSDCKENYFVMPGKDRAFSKVDVNDKRTRRAVARRTVYPGEVMRALSTMDVKQSRKEWHVNAVLLRTLLAAGALALPMLLPGRMAMAAGLTQINGVLIPHTFSLALREG